jgi:hypothetical protein
MGPTRRGRLAALIGATHAQEHRLALRQDLGLDDQLALRYGRWLASALRGDLGVVLDVGGTRITRAGLEKISRMEQLRSLDVWANRLDEADLTLVERLPNLEYLSVGNYDIEPRLDPDKIVAMLLRMASLKRVWLDGVRVTDAQKKLLQERIASVHVTTG